MCLSTTYLMIYPQYIFMKMVFPILANKYCTLIIYPVCKDKTFLNADKYHDLKNIDVFKNHPTVIVLNYTDGPICIKDLHL